jgi:hypothetical protein
MRDPTVADIHTYYVIAADTTVLVHNCKTLDRAEELFDTLDLKNSTVAVAKVFDTKKNKYVTWVSTNRKGLPGEWKGNNPLAGTGERWISGNGQHAEMNIMDSIVRSRGRYRLDELASSTNMCQACVNRALTMGLKITTDGARPSALYTPWRVLRR